MRIVQRPLQIALGDVRRLVTRRRGSLALAALVLLGVATLAVAGCAPTPGAGGSTAAQPGAIARFTPPPARTPSPIIFSASGPITGVPAIQPHLNGLPAFTSDDMTQYAERTPPPGNLGSGAAPSVVRAEFLTSGVIGGLLGIPPGPPGDTLLGFVELQGSFAFAGATPGAPTPYPYAFELFDARSGNLIGYGALKQPAPAATPTQQPTATPKPNASPTATPIPPKLVVTPGKATEGCGNDSWPVKFTVANAGGGTLNWSLSGIPANAAASPSSGALGAGASQMVSISGAVKPARAQFTIAFSSNGGSQNVVITCQ